MDAVISTTGVRPAPAIATGKRFGIRAAAYMIDTIVQMAIYVIVNTALLVVVAVGVTVITGQEFIPVVQDNNCLFNLIFLGLSTLYFTLFEWLYGATPGKLVLGMRVIEVHGGRCTLGAAFVRALFRLIDGLFFGFVAYATMKEPLNQRLGDETAKTIVVSSKDAAIQQPRAWWWFLVAAGCYLAVNTVVCIFLIG